jgi:hypothetical protein
VDAVEGLGDARLRTMADIRALYQPWCAALPAWREFVSARGDHSKDYPICVAFQGDSPVEYWSEEEPEEPEPFGLKEVGRRLAALGRGPA